MRRFIQVASIILMVMSCVALAFGLLGFPTEIGRELTGVSVICFPVAGIAFLVGEISRQVEKLIQQSQPEQESEPEPEVQAHRREVEAEKEVARLLKS